jgi:hypothetical protein
MRAVSGIQEGDRRWNEEENQKAERGYLNASSSKSSTIFSLSL